MLSLSKIIYGLSKDIHLISLLVKLKDGSGVHLIVSSEKKLSENQAKLTYLETEGFQVLKVDELVVEKIDVRFSKSAFEATRDRSDDDVIGLSFYKDANIFFVLTIDEYDMLDAETQKLLKNYAHFSDNDFNVQII